MIGTEMKVKVTADMPAIFHGMRVKVLRKSPATHGLTVEVLEKRGCYRIGDTLHVAPCDVEPLEPASATPTVDAMLDELKRHLRILLDAGGADRERVLDTLSGELSMDDLDALQERLP